MDLYCTVQPEAFDPTLGGTVGDVLQKCLLAEHEQKIHQFELLGCDARIVGKAPVGGRGIVPKGIEIAHGGKTNVGSLE